jgi:hypothetical protein
MVKHYTQNKKKEVKRNIGRSFLKKISKQIK